MTNGKNSNNSIVKKRLKNVNSGCNLFFVKPGRSADAYATAKRLAAISKVQEVMITEGEYGFVVRSEGAFDSEDPVLEKISKLVGASPKKAISYCQVRQD